MKFDVDRAPLNNSTNNTALLRREATRLGFDFVGIARAEFMEPEARRLEAWLNQNYHGRMGYMANHFDKRVDPTKLVPGAKSVVSLLYNYFPKEEQRDPDAPKLARYAYGEDYHHVIRERLTELVDTLRTEIGDIDGRVFVDSAPVLERDWAARAGNGWMGKNTLLLHPRAGSYFFLAEIISDLELEPDAGPMRDHCGTCTRCIDACPTDAISPEGYVLDATRCISYLTIELRGAIPDEFSGKMENWAFGCDICQEVCPLNRCAKPHSEPRFDPPEALLDLDRRAWMEMTKDVFREVLGKSAVRRARFKGLKRNLKFLRTHEPRA